MLCVSFCVDISTLLWSCLAREFFDLCAWMLIKFWSLWRQMVLFRYDNEFDVFTSVAWFLSFSSSAGEKGTKWFLILTSIVDGSGEEEEGGVSIVTRDERFFGGRKRETQQQDEEEKRIIMIILTGFQPSYLMWTFLSRWSIAFDIDKCNFFHLSTSGICWPLLINFFIASASLSLSTRDLTDTRDVDVILISSTRNLAAWSNASD